MKKIAILLIIVVVIVAYFLMSSFNASETSSESKVQHMLKYYQNTYVGDNSSVGGILNDLFMSNNIKSFALETNDKPYAITVKYLYEEGIGQEAFDKTMEYNATALFALVQNLDILYFDIESSTKKSYTFKRQSIEEKYDDKLSSYLVNEETWMNEVFNKILE